MPQLHIMKTVSGPMQTVGRGEVTVLGAFDVMHNLEKSLFSSTGKV